MKSYPTISGPSSIHLSKQAYVFVKYDGSNLRFEWSRKKGWYKFGTRRTLIDETHPIYGSATCLFLDKYGDDFERIFIKNKALRGVRSVVVFAEWFGAKSFSGMHQPEDPKDLIIFDVNPHKKGFLSPKEFLDLFGHLSVAELIYSGNVGKEFIQSVKEETIDIESRYKIRAEIPEGVVCKGGKGHRLWMSKIKTERYKAALKSKYSSNWEKYWE